MARQPGYFSDLDAPRLGKHRVAVVSCGKAKLDHAAPAADLYTGDVVRKSIAWVCNKLMGSVVDDWFILSAEHGVLEPGTVVAPYDRCLADHDDDERWEWRGLVWEGFHAFCEARGWDPRDVEMVMVTGSDYLDVFCGRIPQLWPMDGLGLGERKAFLKAVLG